MSVTSCQHGRWKMVDCSWAMRACVCVCAHIYNNKASPVSGSQTLSEPAVEKSSFIFLGKLLFKTVSGPSQYLYPVSFLSLYTQSGKGSLAPQTVMALKNTPFSSRGEELYDVWCIIQLHYSHWKRRNWEYLWHGTRTIDERAMVWCIDHLLEWKCLVQMSWTLFFCPFKTIWKKAARKVTV